MGINGLCPCLRACVRAPNGIVSISVSLSFVVVLAFFAFICFGRKCARWFELDRIKNESGLINGLEVCMYVSLFFTIMTVFRGLSVSFPAILLLELFYAFRRVRGLYRDRLIVFIQEKDAVSLCCLFLVRQFGKPLFQKASPRIETLTPPCPHKKKKRKSFDVAPNKNVTSIFFLLARLRAYLHINFIRYFVTFIFGL